MTRRVAVIGGGAWGTALAILAAESGARTTLWFRRPEAAGEVSRARENVRYLPGVRIPEAVEIAHGADIPEADVWIGAIPTQHIRSVAGEFRLQVPRGAVLVSTAKGIEQATGLRPSQVWREAAGAQRVVVLSGPSHAEEVGRGLPASVVAASEDQGAAEQIQTMLTSGRFRVYTSGDTIGVELAGALKNVVALAAGIADGLALGDNAKAALIVRGAVEMARFGRARGARRETFFGLAGVGDLITSCASPHGRNLRVGRAIGRGATLEAALGTIAGVAEGVWTTRVVVAQARAAGVEMPIAEGVAAVLFGGVPAREALRALMARAPKSEDEDWN